MYFLKVKHCFDSAHFLSGHKGKCANIHGHRWEVEVEIKSKELIEEGEQRGMVIDFGLFKKDVRAMADALDHALIIEEGSLGKETKDCLLAEGFRLIQLPFRPTAENFALYFFNHIKGLGYAVKRVTVYETPTNIAMYEEDEV